MRRSRLAAHCTLALGAFAVGVATGPLALWLLLALCMGSAVGAQTTGAAAGLAVKLDSVEQLRKGADAWPLIANPSTPAQQRINATLTRLNQKLAESLKQCDADYRDWAKQVGSDTTKDSGGGWERTVRVTMTGPRFLSMVAADSQFCGGAYPNAESFAMVFDLDSGRPVNWMRLLAASAKAGPHSDSMYDGTTVGTLIVPALLAMSKDKAGADCKDTFEEDQSYQLWPDAKTGTLFAEPFGMPHAVAACADDLALPIDQARKLGFDETVLNALDRAHRVWMASDRGKH
jgi:hypothetical protein